MVDSATLALAVGLIVSLAFTEAFGLAAGGMIVPGYLALYVRQPVNIVLTLIAALVTFAVVRLISRYTIIYGRRRVVIAILFGFLVGSLMRGGIQWCQMAWPESAAAGSCVCVTRLHHSRLDRALDGSSGSRPDDGASDDFDSRRSSGPDHHWHGGGTMKTLYWRPDKASARTLYSIAMVAVVGLAIVEFSPRFVRDANHEIKLSAVQHATRMMCAIKEQRQRLGHRMNRFFDPHGTGMVGEAMTSVTSRPAELDSKRASCNPQFAAAVVDMLVDAGLRRGDRVAIGWTGSLPAMNIATCAAVEALGLQPVAVASAMSSQYGANMPDFMWVDMEKTLADAGELSFRSKAVSIGGAADRGMGMSDESLRRVRQAIERTGQTAMSCGSLTESINERMRIYGVAEDDSITAYVNVGGGIASTGGTETKKLFRPGLNTRAPRGELADGVMKRFMNQGIPVIHLVEVHEIAARYGISDDSVTMDANQVALAAMSPPNRWMAIVILATILVTMRASILTGWKRLIHQFIRPKQFDSHPDPQGPEAESELRLMV